MFLPHSISHVYAGNWLSSGIFGSAHSAPDDEFDQIKCAKIGEPNLNEILRKSGRAEFASRSKRRFLHKSDWGDATAREIRVARTAGFGQTISVLIRN